jgi:hypothetical protein
MPSYVVDVQLLKVEPATRCLALDQVMDSFGFFPFRSGVAPEDSNIATNAATNAAT